MSVEDIRESGRRTNAEIWNEGRIAVIDELFAPDFVYHDPSNPAVRTREDYKRYITEMRGAFPDLRITIDDTIVEGEQGVMRWTFQGTNTGDIPGPARVPATGKKVTMTGVTIGRSAGGKVVELWNQSDNLGMLRQLGLIPELQPAG